MEHFDRNQFDSRRRPDGEVDEAALVRKLAHELNSLLDGSIRCLSQVQRSLDAEDEQAGEPPDTCLRKLDLAQDAMLQMAQLLDRAMSDPHRGLTAALEAPGTLEDAVDRILPLLQPLAEEAGVELAANIDPAARPIPSGALGALITNALRNAIEACAHSAMPERQVELSITTVDRELRILVLDNGPGVQSSDDVDRGSGRGLGLRTCGEIARELDGHCRLTNVPFGRGALFEVCLPLSRLAGA